MSQQNLNSARRWFEEVWNQRRGEVADELLTPESVCLTAAGPVCGAEPFREQMYKPFLAAFPDLHITMEGTVAEGDQIAVRWRATGTHTGDGLGIAPTGKAITIYGMTWIRFENGKMMEGWDCWDRTGLLESLKT